VAAGPLRPAPLRGVLRSRGRGPRPGRPGARHRRHPGRPLRRAAAAGSAPTDRAGW
jgi:hypothetical protein